MLNISPENLKNKIDQSQYHAFGMVMDKKTGRTLARWIVFLTVLVFFGLFLPWTQNVRTDGYLTAVNPEQRPQTIHSVIDGRIERWYVQEGDYVNRGDTLVFISEIKDDYFDPELLVRTERQLQAKKQSVNAYGHKVSALENQIKALEETQVLKIEQAKNYLRQTELKVVSDSIDLVAAETNYKIADYQYERIKQLYEEGLKSLTDLEIRELKRQETLAKRISAENKLLQSKNDLINAQIELISLEAQFRDKIAKSFSDRFSAESDQFEAELSVAKLETSLTNYSMRFGFYFITAPQNGYVTQAMITGIGETIKQGQPLCSVMPSEYELAVEMYIKPLDLPLMSLGQKVRFIFDGWPVIVFTGWPGLTFGTFGGKIIAIDNFASANGKYRILVAPDTADKPWPEALRVGSGARGIILLKTVPIYYELWRQLNGFPPDYYKPINAAKGYEVKK